jgi:hypothetical protein
MSVAIPLLPLCTHPSLYAGSSFVVLQIRRVALRLKDKYSDPSMDRSIGMVRQIHQVFQPSRAMFVEWRRKQEVAQFTTFLQRKEKH